MHFSMVNSGAIYYDSNINSHLNRNIYQCKSQINKDIQPTENTDSKSYYQSENLVNKNYYQITKINRVNRDCYEKNLYFDNCKLLSNDILSSVTKSIDRQLFIFKRSLSDYSVNPPILNKYKFNKTTISSDHLNCRKKDFISENEAIISRNSLKRARFDNFPLNRAVIVNSNIEYSNNNGNSCYSDIFTTVDSISSFFDNGHKKEIPKSADNISETTIYNTSTSKTDNNYRHQNCNKLSSDTIKDDNNHLNSTNKTHGSENKVDNSNNKNQYYHSKQTNHFLNNLLKRIKSIRFSRKKNAKKNSRNNKNFKNKKIKHNSNDASSILDTNLLTTLTNLNATKIDCNYLNNKMNLFDKNNSNSIDGNDENGETNYFSSTSYEQIINKHQVDKVEICNKIDNFPSYTFSSNENDIEGIVNCLSSTNYDYIRNGANYNDNAAFFSSSTMNEHCLNDDFDNSIPSIKDHINYTNSHWYNPPSFSQLWNQFNYIDTYRTDLQNNYAADNNNNNNNNNNEQDIQNNCKLDGEIANNDQTKKIHNSNNDSNNQNKPNEQVFNKKNDIKTISSKEKYEYLVFGRQVEGVYAPNHSIEGFACETIIRALDIPYRVNYQVKSSTEPVFLTFQTNRLTGIKKILQYLKLHFKIDIDSRFGSKERSIIRAMNSMILNQTNLFVNISRYKINFEEWKQIDLELKKQNYLKQVICRSNHMKHIKQHCENVGIHYWCDNSIMSYAELDLKALSTILADKKFFFSDKNGKNVNRISSLDCLTFALVANIYYCPIKESRLKVALETKFRNLVQHCERMRQILWADWDRRCYKPQINLERNKTNLFMSTIIKTRNSGIFKKTRKDERFKNKTAIQSDISINNRNRQTNLVKNNNNLNNNLDNISKINFVANSKLNNTTVDISKTDTKLEENLIDGKLEENLIEGKIDENLIQGKLDHTADLNDSKSNNETLLDSNITDNKFDTDRDKKVKLHNKKSFMFSPIYKKIVSMTTSKQSKNKLDDKNKISKIEDCNKVNSRQSIKIVKLDSELFNYTDKKLSPTNTQVKIDMEPGSTNSKNNENLKYKNENSTKLVGIETKTDEQNIPTRPNIDIQQMDKETVQSNQTNSDGKLNQEYKPIIDSIDINKVNQDRIEIDETKSHQMDSDKHKVVSYKNSQNVIMDAKAEIKNTTEYDKAEINKNLSNEIKENKHGEDEIELNKNIYDENYVDNDVGLLLPNKIVDSSSMQKIDDGCNNVSTKLSQSSDCQNDGGNNKLSQTNTYKQENGCDEKENEKFNNKKRKKNSLIDVDKETIVDAIQADPTVVDVTDLTQQDQL